MCSAPTAQADEENRLSWQRMLPRFQDAAAIAAVCQNRDGADTFNGADSSVAKLINFNSFQRQNCFSHALKNGDSIMQNVRTSRVNARIAILPGVRNMHHALTHRTIACRALLTRDQGITRPHALGVFDALMAMSCIRTPSKIGKILRCKFASAVVPFSRCAFRTLEGGFLGHLVLVIEVETNARHVLLTDD